MTTTPGTRLVYTAAISLPNDEPVTDIEVANLIAASHGLGDRAVEPEDPSAWDVGVWLVDLTDDLIGQLERDGQVYLVNELGSITVETY